MFLLRFDVIQQMIEENKKKETIEAEKEKEIALTLRTMNEIKLGQFEEKKTVLEIQGDNFRLRGIFYF